jgi:REP-associated tyrosine transposase
MVGLEDSAHPTTFHQKRADPMPQYRRCYVPGGMYFFTAVTHKRRPILTTPLGRKLLRAAFVATQAKRPFNVFAIVLLPDHLHCIWCLPEGDSNYSIRWASIKEAFTRAFLDQGGKEGPVSASRIRHRERGVWQRRFWEHVIQNEDELIRCVDYIHWNPVKHGLVSRVRDYPWSSFHHFVKSGDYNLDWGSGGVVEDVPGAEWE